MNKDQDESALDVRLLQKQELPEDAFPGGKGEVFRVFFTPEVHAALWKHGSENTTVEICGVLVGAWQRDANGPFVRIVESIRGEAAQSKFAEVTFTHETWSKINAEMDTKHLGLSIVGWYHTHPDFGVFLSDRDRFIQEHFFSSPGQVAHVIDPIRKAEGVFVWRKGKPTLAEHFWVGDRIIFDAAASAGEPRSIAAPGHSAAPAASPPPRPPEERVGSLLPSPGRMMIYLCVFLIGYLLSGLRSRWEQQMIEQGVLADLGIWKGARLGLRDQLENVSRDLSEISRATRGLEERLAKADDKSKESNVREIPWSELRLALGQVAFRVDQIRSKYGYTPEEEAMILGIARSQADSSGIEKKTPPEAAADAAVKSDEKGKGEEKSARSK
jgi:proteasome lid subunit RPN8/RPN11